MKNQNHVRCILSVILYSACLVFLSSGSWGTSPLRYSTYLSGTNDEAEGKAIGVDSAGNIYVTGYTEKADFPTTSTGYDTTYPGTGNETFLCKINPNLSSTASLVYSTLFGGSSTNSSEALAVSPGGIVYITGYTYSTDFPVTAHAIQSTGNGTEDAFVAIINPSYSGVSSLVYSSYLGGSTYSVGWGIAADSAGMIYVDGFTGSVNFPVTSNAFSATNSGNEDAFFCKINPTLSGLSSLLYSTYIGGSNSDYCYALAIDNAGNAYIAGYTSSANYPTTPNAFSTTYRGIDNVFVSIINPNLSGSSSLVYSTYVGGTSIDSPDGMTVDSQGDIYVAGYTNSWNFPVTSNALETAIPSAKYHGFFFELNPALSGVSSLVYATFLGGTSVDECYGAAVDTAGYVYVTGYTFSNDFPVTSNGYETSSNENDDAFISQFNTRKSGNASLVYSTYLGGDGYDVGYAIAVDNSGNVYLTGFTSSDNFPISSNAFDTSLHGAVYSNTAAFVTMLSIPQPLPVGDWMLYATDYDQYEIQDPDIPARHF